MPISISESSSYISPNALRKFQREFGIILSPKQFKKQQQTLIANALNSRRTIVEELGKLDRKEILSFIFVLSQFGDVSKHEVPSEYLLLENNPFVVEWTGGNYSIPKEVLEYFAYEKIFKEQNYLFALIPALSMKEKKAWIKWLGIDFQGETEWELNHELYNQCRMLQKPFNGKSYIHEKEFRLEQLWRPGQNKYIDWFYKGLTTFYFAVQELSRFETDPFFVHVVHVIKAGKFILKKLPERFGERDEHILVLTIEGTTPQLRNTVYEWETNRENKNELFR